MSNLIDPRSLWRGDELGSTAAVTTTLEPGDLGPIVETARLLAASGVTPEDLVAADLPLGPLASKIDDLSQEVMTGRGLTVLAGFPVDDLDAEEVAIVFWAIGLGLGAPVSQSVMGDRLGHITDMSKSDPHARAYRNSKELTPHSDPADILAFLCLHPAASGGISRFVSSMTIHEEIRRRRPDLLAPLYRGFRYHRFGEQAADSDPVTPHLLPVFSSHDGHISCRYLRQYIEIAADEFDNIELSAQDTEALDLLEEIAAEPGVCLEFTLGRGEAIFANNFTVLHARSHFADHEDSARKRHLLRLWIAAHNPRPIAPRVSMYDGEPGIPPVRGQMPSYQNNIELN